MTVFDHDAALRRALSALERSRAKIEATERERTEPIAIIGAGCRLPGGVGDIEAFWSLVHAGRDAISELPLARWRVADLVDANRSRPGKLYNAAMGVIDNADCFDAAYFGISPREAERMDPQQRVLLEVAVEALEQAGLSMEALRGSDTGAFIGICANDFANRFGLSALDTYSATGRAPATASGRLSYTFGWHGPAMSIDTACSSSLVAVHLACQSLRRRETSLAMVGGVHVTAGPETSVSMAKLNALSPTGRCHAFSADGDGYVRGEGCVVLMLKRLSDAQRDGDAILATIRATGVNQDGRSNGLTAPNGTAQAALLRGCLQSAGLTPRQVGYLEAHGTGTELGDPIELGAAWQAYGEGRDGHGDALWVGSGKTNVGHLEAAAGIAGLLRAALALHHATIPPSLHLGRPNPHIDWHRPLKVPTQAMPFPLNDAGDRIAGVSSFGFSGTNAHVLLAQWAATPSELDEAPGTGAPMWVALSASSDAALRARASDLADRLAGDEANNAAMCRATQARGTTHAERLAVAAPDAASLVQRLRAHAAGQLVEGVFRGRGRARQSGVVAVFSGQGSHWEGMGRDLYADEQGAFRRTFDACDAAIVAQGGTSVKEALLAKGWGENGFDSDVMQPLLFAMAVAMAEHVRALGVRIQAVVGQSMGEIAAAVVAGVLTVEEGARIAVLRGRLALRAEGGAMAMVELALQEVEALIVQSGHPISVAASNGPAATLVSGDSGAIAAFVEAMTARGVYSRKLRVAYASHSAFMAPLLAPLSEGLQGLAPRTGTIPIYSTVTASRIEGTSLTAAHWAANLRQPVLLHPALLRLIEDGYSLFLELSPKPMLLPSIEETLRSADVPGCAVACMRDDQPAALTAQMSLARLFAAGAPLHLSCERSVAVPLPYPWVRTPYPLPAPAAGVVAADGWAGLLGSGATMAGDPLTWVFDGRVTSEHEVVSAHRVLGAAVLPGAGYIHMALHAARQVWPGCKLQLDEVAFEHVLALRSDQPSAFRLQLVLREDGDHRASWHIGSLEETEPAQPAMAPRRDARWTRHASGRIHALDAGLSSLGDDVAAPLAHWQATLTRCVDAQTLYRTLAGSGLDYGPAFQRVHTLWHDGDTFLARLSAPGDEHDDATAETAVLDGCLHGLAWMCHAAGEGLQVPIASASLALEGDPRRAVWVQGVRRASPAPSSSAGGEASTAELVLMDQSGGVVARWKGLQARSPEAAAGEVALPAQGRWLHAQQWQPMADAAGQPATARPWLLISDSCALTPVQLDRLRAGLGRQASILHWDRADGATHLARAVQAWRDGLGAEDRPRAAIAYLGASVGVAPMQERKPAARLEVSVGALHLVQAVLAAFGEQALPRLAWVTQGTQWVSEALPASDAVVAPLSMAAVNDAALWGFARTQSIEYPSWQVRCIDLPPALRADDMDALSAMLQAEGRETEIALREQPWAARLAVSPLPPEAMLDAAQAAAQPWRLEIDKPGVLGTLTWRAARQAPPGLGEVEIRVEAAALNFADVMRAMGFFVDADERPVRLGSECAGVVTRVAPDVTTFRPGQRVVALADHALASHVRTRAACVVPIPQGWTAQDICAVPIASMTAWYALRTVAGLLAGERILIHSATGGTGLAAVHLALALGAEVYATAGSDAKREILRALGIRHVFDSRSGAFEEGVMAATQGRGVDVVLNALSGRAIEQSLRVLASDGWFLELGKRDIYEGGRLPLHHFKKRIRYAAIDLAGMQRERPDRFAALFQTVMDAVADKFVRSLPTQVYGADRAEEAFHHMATAQHVGKLVLALDAPPTALSPASGPAPVLRGRHLITGGLGALGLALADWLVGQGAEHLVLLGRSAPSEAALACIDALRARGVAVDVVHADVGSHADLAAQWPAIERGAAPLRGIYHLAGVLRDGVIEGQTQAHFEDVLAPKIAGAWNLHVLSASAELDHFVLYSSAAALLPSASQAGYAAANAFLDALAMHRRAAGLAALSIQWGPFAEIGLAASAADRGERLAQEGADSMGVQDAHRHLGVLMKRNVSCIGVFPLDGPKWLAAHATLAATPRYAGMADGHPSAAAMAGHAEAASALAALRQASPGERVQRLQAVVTQQAAAVLRQPEEDLGPDATFQQLGMDSLTGLELRNRLEGLLGLRLSAALLWRHPTAQALAEHLLSQLQAAWGGEPPPGPLPAPPAHPMQSLAAKASNEAERWFLVPQRVQTPRLRLFCVPFLGGLGSVFSGWPSHLPADVEVQALQMPGRPPRHREASHEDFHRLVDVLREAITPRLDVPYALYGHSLGALLGFGLVHALKAAGAPLPKHLFLAAYPAAHLHNPLRDICDLDEEAFIQALTRLRGIPEQVLRDRELLEVFLPSLRADLRLLKSYVHDGRQERLSVPTTVLYGAHDHLVEPAEIQAWSQHFAGFFETRRVEGGHFFVREQEDAVLAHVRGPLQRITSGDA